MPTAKPQLTLHNNSDNPRSLLRLVGMPPPNVVDTSHTAAPGLASSAESLAFNAMAFPTLGAGELPADKCIDTIDASNEDPFTLDTFEALIRMHTANGKDFILARVVTVDENEHLYYSYYAAHHINKVLFRTQPEEGLLHRMKAKNPMNNLPVVGDVHYYRLRTSDPAHNPLVVARQPSKKPAKQPAAVETPMKNLNNSKNNGSILSAPAAMDYEAEELTMAQALSASPPKSGREYTRRSSFIADEAASASSYEAIGALAMKASDDLQLDTTNNKNSATTIAELKKWAEELPSIQSTASYTAPEPEEDADPTAAAPMVFTAQYYATDDDYLMRRFVREYFKQNTLNPEDIFLFTLFGGSQTSNVRGAFIAPLVSDPTNPSAVATSMEHAVKMYQQQQKKHPAGPLSALTTTATQLAADGTTNPTGSNPAFRSLRTGNASSANGSLWSRLRNSLSSPAVGTANNNNNNNNNNSSNSDLDSVNSPRSLSTFFRQVFRLGPRQPLNDREHEGVNQNNNVNSHHNYATVRTTSEPGSPMSSAHGDSSTVDLEAQRRRLTLFEGRGVWRVADGVLVSAIVVLFCLATIPTMPTMVLLTGASLCLILLALFALVRNT